MPIFKSDLGLVYFFHVPKCGGSSIEEELLKNKIKLSFYEGDFWNKSKSLWYKSSPQHITTQDLQSLFKDDIFSYKFTVLRDPVSRLLSAYNHNRKKIGYFTSFKKFLATLEKNYQTKNDFFGKRFDNHFLPANRLVPEGCDIFYLEYDIKTLENKLSKILQIEIDLSKKANKARYKVNKVSNLKDLIKKFVPQSPRIDELSNDIIIRIKRLYKEDYERFDFK